MLAQPYTTKKVVMMSQQNRVKKASGLYQQTANTNKKNCKPQCAKTSLLLLKPQ